MVVQGDGLKSPSPWGCSVPSPVVSGVPRQTARSSVTTAERGWAEAAKICPACRVPRCPVAKAMVRQVASWGKLLAAAPAFSQLHPPLRRFPPCTRNRHRQKLPPLRTLPRCLPLVGGAPPHPAEVVPRTKRRRHRPTCTASTRLSASRAGQKQAYVMLMCSSSRHSTPPMSAAHPTRWPRLCHWSHHRRVPSKQPLREMQSP